MARVTKRGALGERARRTTERIRKKEIEDVPGSAGGGSSPVFFYARGASFGLNLETDGLGDFYCDFPFDERQSGGFTRAPLGGGIASEAIHLPAAGLWIATFYLWVHPNFDTSALIDGMDAVSILWSLDTPGLEETALSPYKGIASGRKGGDSANVAFTLSVPFYYDGPVDPGDDGVMLSLGFSATNASGSWLSGDPTSVTLERSRMALQLVGAV